MFTWKLMTQDEQGSWSVYRTLAGSYALDEAIEFAVAHALRSNRRVSVLSCDELQVSTVATITRQGYVTLMRVSAA
jgi:hypothetical protein